MAARSDAGTPRTAPATNSSITPMSSPATSRPRSVSVTGARYPREPGVSSAPARWPTQTSPSRSSAARVRDVAARSTPARRASSDDVTPSGLRAR